MIVFRSENIFNTITLSLLLKFWKIIVIFHLNFPFKWTTCLNTHFKNLLYKSESRNPQDVSVYFPASMMCRDIDNHAMAKQMDKGRRSRNVQVWFFYLVDASFFLSGSWAIFPGIFTAHTLLKCYGKVHPLKVDAADNNIWDRTKLFVPRGIVIWSAHDMYIYIHRYIAGVNDLQF